jgi:DNA polymerase
MTIARTRGKLMTLPDHRAVRWLVTIHPSWPLRIRDAGDRKAQYRAFVADLRRAKAAIAG